MTTDTAPQARAVLTIRETCDYLSLGKNTVYGLINSGDLPSFTIGRSRRVLRTDIDSFIARQRGETRT